jgi:hypothetical protein
MDTSCLCNFITVLYPNKKGTFFPPLYSPSQHLHPPRHHAIHTWMDNGWERRYLIQVPFLLLLPTPFRSQTMARDKLRDSLVALLGIGKGLPAHHLSAQCTEYMWGPRLIRSLRDATSGYNLL